MRPFLLAPRGAIFFVVIFAFTGGAAWAVPQNESHKPLHSLAEYNAFVVVSAGRDAQAKIKLLDVFVANFPESTLKPYAYIDYYQAYFSLQQFSRTVANADDLLALGDKILPDPGAYDTPEAAADSVVDSRLTGFAARASAYIVGCDEKELQTPEASLSAKESAEQGLRLLDQSPNLPSFRKVVEL